MTDPLAIQGNYADFKLVKTRSVVQMIIEVPIERAKEVVDAFGIPQPSAEIPVAVARIHPTAKTQALANETLKPTRKPAATRAEKARRLCGVAAFQFWLASREGVQEYGFAQLSKDEMYAQTVKWMKGRCEILSSKELDEDPDAQFLWDTLLAEYEQASGRMAERHG